MRNSKLNIKIDVIDLKKGLGVLFVLFIFTGIHAQIVENELQNKPNIVLFMADDIGLGDIGFYHKERTGKKPLVPTPNIDKLIEKGMRFADAHSPSSLCAPTRFSMMTGNFSYRNTANPWGVWSPAKDAGIKPDFTTIAEMAKKGGYKTAFMGKWGLGGLWNGFHKEIEKYKQTDCENGGEAFGFDYSLILPQGIQNKPYVFYENGRFRKIEENSELVSIPFEQTKYTEDNRNRGREGIGDSNWDPSLAGPILANQAVEYIYKLKDAEKPFFLYYCSQAVHVPHTPTKQMAGKNIAGTTLGKHGDMIKELDTQVGMMIEALMKSGQYQNTLFVFTSDNGGLNHDKELRDAGHDSSNGLTGKKGSIYEGGHRVPFVVVWSGKIEPGSESNVTIVGHDMVATLSALAGISLDKSKIFDSANLLPVFKGNSNKQVRSYILHASQAANGPFYAIREGDWKLVLRGKNRVVDDNLEVIGLYNLANSLTENDTDNLMSFPGNAVRIEAMKAKYLDLRFSGAATVY